MPKLSSLAPLARIYIGQCYAFTHCRLYIAPYHAHWNDTHTASHMLVPVFPSFLRLGITLATKIILGCINYFHNVSETPSSRKKYPFPCRSNRDTRTYSTCRQVKISFLGTDCIFSSQKMKNYRGRGDAPSHTLPPLGRTLPRKDCAPQMFWLITPLTHTHTHTPHI